VSFFLEAILFFKQRVFKHILAFVLMQIYAH